MAVAVPWDSGNATEGWQVRVWPPGSFLALCWTPISGSYCLLPRILFYFTILFALVGWGHKWLIAGALGASLVYSGQAAIHSCLLAWSGHINGENDLWALGAILSTSAIMAVPLLNWSRSIRDLSLEKEDDDGRRGFSKARTIIVYWAFLAVIGLISVLVLVETPNPERFGYSAFLEIPEGPTNDIVSCAMISSLPHNETFRLPALEFKSRINGTDLGPFLDYDWLQNHHCSNPCSSRAARVGPAFFRQADDYQPATARALIKLTETPGLSTSKDHLAVNFQTFVLTWSIFVLPYVIMQGAWAAAFGRRSPTQTRDALYIFLRDGGRPSKLHPSTRPSTHPNRRLLAKIIALCTYFWCLFVTIICMPVLFLTILAVETYINRLPETCALTSIDSWLPWAGTALVLLAALISRFHNPAVAALTSGSTKEVLLRTRRSFGNGLKHISLPIWRWMRETPSFEWKSFRQFWADADNAVWFDRHGRRLMTSLDSDQMRAVHTVGSLPIDLGTVVPHSSWLFAQKTSVASATQPLTVRTSASDQNASTSTFPVSIHGQETEMQAPNAGRHPDVLPNTVLESRRTA